MLVLQTMIARLAPILQDRPRLRLVYLFGSQAVGKAGPLSDVDIGALFDEEEDILQASAEIAHQISRVLAGRRVDLVSLGSAPIELAYAVIAQGVCIYRRSEAERIDFEANTLSRYGDYLPVLRAMRQSVLEEESHERRVQRYRAAFRRTERTLSQIRANQQKDAG